MMTQPPDLAAIATLAREAKARADRATPGPWVEGQKKLRNKPPIDSCPDHETVIAMTAPGQGVFADPPGGSYPHFDGKFIAAARSDVPALADAVLALVERVRELEASPVMPEAPNLTMIGAMCEAGYGAHWIGPTRHIAVYNAIRAALLKEQAAE